MSSDRLLTRSALEKRAIRRFHAVPHFLINERWNDHGPDSNTGAMEPWYRSDDGITQAFTAQSYADTPCQGLRVKAESEMKGQKYPVTWACRQKLEPDGRLTLRETSGV